MARTLAKYSAVLIALYLGVAYGSNLGQVFKDATDGGVNVVKAFQGR